MKKIGKSLKKTLVCCTALSSFMVISPLIVETNFSNNSTTLNYSDTNKNSLNINQYQNSEVKTLKAIEDQETQPYADRFKIKTIANATTENEKTQIDAIYSGRQSDVNVGYGSDQQLSSVSSLPTNGLLNLFTFTDKVIGITGDISKRPKIEVLSKADKTKNENVTTNLSSFNKIGETDISENLLNSLGILFVKITTYDKSAQSTVYTDYVMLSGFGSSLSSSSSSGVLTPNGEEFKKKVPDLSNNDLANYPTFVSDFENKDTVNTVKANTDPQMKIVSNRQDDARNGSVKYDVNFNWEINEQIYNSAKVTNTGTGTSNSGQKSYLNREMEKSFSISGFQPSSNITTRETVIIVASIIAAGVVVSICVYIVSLFTRKIRNSRKM